VDLEGSHDVGRSDFFLALLPQPPRLLILGFATTTVTNTVNPTQVTLRNALDGFPEARLPIPDAPKDYWQPEVSTGTCLRGQLAPWQLRLQALLTTHTRLASDLHGACF
jgi:hypothetical protein